MLWLVLVLLTFNVALATIWFTYALLIESRFSENLLPRAVIDHTALGRLLTTAGDEPAVREAVILKVWDRLGGYGLTAGEKQFLRECPREQLAVMVDTALKSARQRTRR
ncbi:MAG: hypothetical protein HY318_10700 [Armatimonadetes bacterium]|nr:hypothetical protein [Armatimonadota bacterium]